MTQYKSAIDVLQTKIREQNEAIIAQQACIRRIEDYPADEKRQIELRMKQLTEAEDILVSLEKQRDELFEAVQILGD